MNVVILKCVVIALFVCSCGADNKTVRGRYYPRYHLSPPYGWMNDPNGFSKFQGSYHLFYQHNPESSLEAGVAHWGHARSPDLFHWEHLPIALYPDVYYDEHGVFSGSTFIENDTMYLFYTGNHKKPDVQQQAIATSTDGVNFTKYEGNPVLIGEGFQPHLRDPQVWKNDDMYYMVLGNRFNTSETTSFGRIFLYASKDMYNWEQVSTLGESDGFLGYMWECPTFFKLGKYYVLLFSPQGVDAQGDKYRNLYQTGYIVGNFDYETLRFTPITFFRELDNGHDFYASQIINDNGEVIVVGWFDMWDTGYAESNDGFTGCITMPRKLSLGPNGILYQSPADGVSNAIGKNLYTGKGKGCKTVELPDKSAEIKITAPRNKNLQLYIESDDQNVTISFDYLKGKVILDRGGDEGIRRTTWRPQGRKLKWRVFVDASTIELFCGEGENTFSSRFFPSDPVRVRIGKDNNVDEFIVNAMKRTVPVPDN